MSAAPHDVWDRHRRLEAAERRTWRLPTASPVFEELRSLIVKTFGIADALRTALAPRNVPFRLMPRTRSHVSSG